MSKTTKALAAATAAAGLLLAGCSGAGGETNKTDITLVYAPVNYEVAFIAQQEGYFTDLGLNVTLKPGGTPQDNLAQVMGGSADLTIVAWDTLVTASAEDVPVLAVASAGVVSSKYDTSGVFVRADSTFNSVADLKDAKVGFSDLGGGAHICMQQAFEKVGFKASDLNAVRIPYASMLSSLEDGQIDAVVPADSFYWQMKSNPQFREIANPVREFRAGLPVTLWAANEQWLAQNPQTGTKVIEAMEKATDFYNDPANHDAVIKLREQVSEIDANAAELMKTEFSVPIPLGVTQQVTEALVHLGAVENADKVKTSKELVWDQAPTSD